MLLSYSAVVVLSYCFQIDCYYYYPDGEGLSVLFAAVLIPVLPKVLQRLLLLLFVQPQPSPRRSKLCFVLSDIRMLLCMKYSGLPCIKIPRLVLVISNIHIQRLARRLNGGSYVLLSCTKLPQNEQHQIIRHYYHNNIDIAVSS
jgi:hypothetical protein